MNQQRILWIDQLRGFCMLAILLFHTEAYYTDNGEIIPYNIYVANVLSAFFFISGYLFDGKKPFSPRVKVVSIIRHILVPYVVFSLLLALPKTFMTDYRLTEVLLNILLGRSSWFVAALLVAELLMTAVMSTGKRWIIHLSPWLTIVLAWKLTGVLPDEYNVWKFHNALIAYLFLYAGWLYRQHEPALKVNLRLAPVSMVLLVLIKIYIQRQHESWVIDGVLVSCYPLFLLDMILGIQLLLVLSQLLPPTRLLNYIGRNSLYYYFFCGAAPMAVATVLRYCSFPYTGTYWRVGVAFLLVILLSTAIVAVVSPVYKKYFFNFRKLRRC